MTLAVGSRLGPYEIVAPLGAGGMGEVFRGRDTRLGRDVAIKVIPPGFAQNEQFRARFEREAKTISSLNHPNICTLFDVGHEDGTHFLVMELIEGESLADRIQKGPLPLDQVLRYGSQVADALERAHKQGIVHRDLKPGNVMITKTGAKLLDFGLARPATESAVVHGMTEMPTQAKPLTQEGTLLGTFQYMAPEQLEGQEADARTDIFSLGALLYEMATGKRAFEGSNRTSLIAAIVSSHPAPISSVAPMSPPALDHIIKKCLEKDPDDRWQSAHDIASELRWLSEAGSQAGVATTITVRRKTREKLAWGVAALFAVVAAVALGWMIAGAKSEGPARPFHVSINYPPELSVERVVVGTIALSPDGSKLASLVDRKGTTLVSVYDFTTGKANTLETTQDASFPFWSPDARSIGFFAKGKLRRVDAGGGAAQVLADAHEGRGGSWSEEGVIIFAPDIRGPLMRVSANGGAAAAITTPATEGLTHRNPLFLPGGKRFLFIERESRTEPFGRLMAGALDGSVPKLVLERASNAQFADGRLLFTRDRTLLAQRFDPETLELTGAISPIAENLDYWNPRDIANFSASRSGLVAFRHEVSTDSTLAWFDRDGRLVDTLVPASQFSVSSVSRDLRQIAISRTEAGAQTTDIWIVDASSKQTRRATFTNSPSQVSGAFSPNGERLAVSSLTSVSGGGAKGAGWAASALWLQPVTGVRTDKTLLEAAEFIIEDWSPDGRTLIGTSQRTGTSFDITWVAVDDEKPEVRDFVKTAYDERGAQFSPDGRWVAYIANESARYEVYLLDFPGGTRKLQVSRDGGGPPTWSSDGREIYFAQPDGTIMAVGVKVGDEVEIGTPVRLGLSDARTSPPFASDGKRFLVTQQSARGADGPVRVIRNWAAGLPE